jgi:hypothetical protein
MFSTKTSGYVCDLGEHLTLLARVSAFEPPLTVEALVECSPGKDSDLRDAIASISAKKPSTFIKTCCGVSPETRFIRRATLDLKRLKEPGYLAEIALNQFRIDSEQNTVAVLNAFDGQDFDPSLANASKEVVFAGLPSAEVTKLQKEMLAVGLYPDRLELSTVASIGAIIDYLVYSNSLKPTIVLELGAQSTQSFIVSSRGLEASRPIAVGLEAMVPVVQKELGLKDEESARKLFFSNTFDFTGMGASLCKRLLKELQSSMGFYEVQTGQSIGQLICTVLPAKLSWLESVIASQIGVSVLNPEFGPWLVARQISLAEPLTSSSIDARKLGLLGTMMRFKSQSDVVTS